MPSLDTNILARLVTGDDAGQTAAVNRLLSIPDATWFVPITVALELEWVLRSRYRLRPAAVMAVFDRLLDNAALDFQHASAIEYALELMGELGRADLADCFHVALAATTGDLPFVTLDEGAARLPGGSLLAA